jgi:tetratricopeptide (TPR) repeat protein
MAEYSCNCFDLTFPKSDKSQYMDVFVQKCLAESVYRFKAEIMTTFNYRDTTDRDAGAELGERMAPMIFAELIMNCDNFFNYFDSLKWNMVKNGSRDEVSSNLKSIDQQMTDGQLTSAHYAYRGTCYFNLGDHVKAKTDLDKAIELDSAAGSAYMLRGLIKEIDGDFIAAKTDFEKCLEFTKESHMTLLITIAERKERDRKHR